MALSRVVTASLVSKLIARLSVDTRSGLLGFYHSKRNLALNSKTSMNSLSTLSSDTSQLAGKQGQSKEEIDSTVSVKVRNNKTNGRARLMRKQTVLHKRQLPSEAKIDNEEWQEFSKNLSVEDSFGTLSGNRVDNFVTRPGISAKKHSREKLRIGNRKDHFDERWVNEFGTMAVDDPDYKDFEIEKRKFRDDEGEEDSYDKPHKPLAATGRKHTQNWYGKKIERLAAEGKIYECIQVLETQMLKEDRVMPNQYVFTVLIGALGRVGYTKKAFSLYNKMKKYGLQPEDPTYTALFNACSNSPWREDGLSRATKLWEQMQENNVQPNLTIYKAMIKAFGRCGDLQLAFSLVDELNSVGLRADEEVFSMLLQACLSDKATGLRYAIEVWRRLKKRKKVAPCIYHYNLLLQIIRDCHVGDPVLANQLIQSKPHTGTDVSLQKIQRNSYIELDSTPKMQGEKADKILPVNENPLLENVNLPSTVQPSVQDKISSVDSKTSWWTYKSDNMTSLMQCVEEANNSPQAISILDADVPNILEHRSVFGEVISLGNLDSKENRLALFGGLPGILSKMKSEDVKPDIKTFMQLLDLIPSDRQSEHDLLAVMKSYDVDKDVAFLNMLIKRRNSRRDHEGAKDVLNLLAQNNLSPDIITYGCLAMGCKRKHEGVELLKSMERADIMPTVYICDILMLQAKLDFSYMLTLCQNMKRLQITPNESIIKKCEYSIEKAKQLIVLKEKGKSVPDKVKSPHFDKEFEYFMKYYKPWLLSANLDAEPHPWEQFRKETPNQQDEHEHS